MPALQKCISRPYIGSEANRYNCTVSAWNEYPQDKETVEQDWAPVRDTAVKHFTALHCTALPPLDNGNLQPCVKELVCQMQTLQYTIVHN
jgi:hypothetical protein